MPRIFISDSTEGGTHGAEVRTSILSAHPELTEADVSLQLNASYNAEDALADMATAFAGGYEAFVYCSSVGLQQLFDQAQDYWNQSQVLRCIFPLGSNSHTQRTYSPDDRSAAITCGASDGADNETAYGNALWFFDDDNGRGTPASQDLSSFSTGVIAGKLLRIKDERSCSWWEAIYAALCTASQNGIPSLNNGYGKIDVAEAIAWTGDVPEDPYIQVGEVGILTATRTLGTMVLTAGEVDNAAEYVLEYFTGGDWEEIAVQEAREFTVSLSHNVVTYFRYKAQNGNGDTEYSNIITALWSENIPLTTFDINEGSHMEGTSVGSQPVGSVMNSYYSSSVATEATEQVMNADIARRYLRIHYAKISNLDIRDFVQLVNNTTAADLSEWGMVAFADMTAGQKARLRLYYAYAIGEMIFLQDEENSKLYERMKMLKRQAFNQMTTLSSGSYEYELERISNS